MITARDSRDRPVTIQLLQQQGTHLEQHHDRTTTVPAPTAEHDRSTTFSGPTCNTPRTNGESNLFPTDM